MKNETLLKLAGTLAVILISVFFLRRFSRSAPDAALLPKESASRISRFEVEGPQGSFTFVHSSGAWMMQKPMEYPADLTIVPPLIDKLAAVKLSEEVSSDPARYGLFGLQDSSATLVRLDRRDEASMSYVNEASFQVGKEGSDFDSAFMRVGGRPSVVLGQGVSAREFTRGFEDWLDKSIASVPQHEIKALRVKTNSGKLELKQGDGKWLAGGKPVPQESVDSLLKPVLETAARFSAERILTSAAAGKLKTGLSKPDMTIEIESDKGPVVLKIGEKDASGQRYVEKAGEKRVLFLVGEWKLEPFRKKEFINLASRGKS